MRIFVENIEDKVLLKDYLLENSHISARQIKLALKDKRLKINKKDAYWDTYVKAGDKIYFFEKEEKTDLVPEDIPLDILYEDEYLLAVNKPAGLLMHPTQNILCGTLANAIAHYYEQSEQKFSIRFLSRLDRDTSGVVVIPKDGRTHKLLDDKCVHKEYLAIVAGHLTPKEGMVDAPIGKEKEGDIKATVNESGKDAITQYKVEQELAMSSVVRLSLLTGRTHQIRIHMTYMGHPVFGDTLYGGDVSQIQRQALHAERVTFVHPYTNQHTEIICEIPLDMQELINRG